MVLHSAAGQLDLIRHGNSTDERANDLNLLILQSVNPSVLQSNRLYSKVEAASGMRKGEAIISALLAALIFFAVLAIQRDWQLTRLRNAAWSAEEFILTTTGIGGGVPSIGGYERLRTYELGHYRAGFYRASPAPLVFAAYRFVIYDRNNKPVFALQSVEGSKDPWTALYDFAGRHGLHPGGSRARPVYTRSLTSDGIPDIIIGQYSGGDHCCTVATIVELGKESVRVLGRLDGLDGLPFEGLEVRKLDSDPPWEIVAHRPYQTSCGSHFDAADVVSVYDYAEGSYTDRTSEFSAFLDSVLRQDLAKWAKAPSLALLQTITLDYAKLGRRHLGDRFLAMNLGRFLPELRNRNVDPNLCMDNLISLVDRLTGGTP